MTKDLKREIEESDEILDASEGDPIDFWEEKQRELVTSVVDYNLGTLTQLVVDGTIDLSPKYQRRFRWNIERQSKLIESFLMNVPVPPIFLNEDQYGQYSVIDGKQRLMAIAEFFRGRLILKGLEIFSDINDHTFDNIPYKLQSVIKTRPTLRAIIILRQSDEDVKFEVFQRLNTGGVRLNPQEIRNSAYPGPLNDLILELSENKTFHKLLGIKNKNQSSIYQEMRDAEFVLRYFTFSSNWRDFKGSMKRLMDRYMSDNQHLDKEKINELRADFLKTIDVVDKCFGEYAYRRYMPEKSQWRKQILASLYDAQMFACKEIDIENVEIIKERIVERLSRLFNEGEFVRAISAATNNIGNFRTRVTSMKTMLNEVLVR